MSENPRFVEQFNKLVNPDIKDVTLANHAKLVKISTDAGSNFFGIIMNKSIVFPFTTGSEVDKDIKNIVMLNNMDLDKAPDKTHLEAACIKMNLPFNGIRDGFYCDGINLGTSNIMALHIYPKEFIGTQEEFMRQISDMFQGVKCLFDIEELPKI